MVTGHSIRHVRRESDKSYEQRYLDWLRRHEGSVNPGAVGQVGNTGEN